MSLTIMYICVRVTIDSTLDDIIQLDAASKEMLLEILQKRQIEERRDQMVKNAQQLLEDYHSDKLTPLTANEAILILGKVNL